jgi:predicted alpha/beta-hydrolase family hydrolase
MGLFDRWRSAGAGLSTEGQRLDALAAEMTKQGVIIITRNGAAYTVYWTRRPDERPARQTSVLKRSVEGEGATVLEALLDCRTQALKQRKATRTTR